MTIISILFGVLFLAAILAPLAQRKLRQAKRLQKIKEIEDARESRVITLITRQGPLAFLNIPMLRALDIGDSEEILRAIHQTDAETPLDLVIHTPGGIMLAGEQIARALSAHEGEVTVFVPHHALSGGTLIALAADRIVMDPNAVLGPVDPQIQSLPAASILEAVSRKDVNEVDDETLILADVGRKALDQMRESVLTLVSARLERDQAKDLAEALTSGQWTHDFPITVERARALNLPVDAEMPEFVHELLELFPQRARQYPSVQYLPEPARKEDENGKANGSVTDRMVTY